MTPTASRTPSKTPGQLAYEDDLSRWPTYSDGRERPVWDAADEYLRLSWERAPALLSTPPTTTA